MKKAAIGVVRSRVVFLVEVLQEVDRSGGKSFALFPEFGLKRHCVRVDKWVYEYAVHIPHIQE